MFITFEGPEGAGKSTQLTLLAAALERAGWAVQCLRDPGGTALGDHLRALLLAPEIERLDARAEALLYAAARAQLVAEVVAPALQQARVVLCDRYVDSTLAYQGWGRGLPVAELRQVVRFASGGYWPDLTLLLDLPPALGLRRKQAQRAAPTGAWTRFEAEPLAFHERVRAGYLALAAAEPQRWVVLDAREDIQALHARIWQEVVRRLPPPPGERSARRPSQHDVVTTAEHAAQPDEPVC
ncbi:MAG TPA: dTMP kinase [Chloroflexota bacterium]|nr:dTMP kinase [Chloroflexota bacterium]